MSTILDALKKSEQERKLANLPELSSMPLPEEEHDARQIWWGLAILTVLVVAIIIYLIVNPDNKLATTNTVVSQPDYQTSTRQASESSYVVGSEVYSYDELSGTVRQVASNLNINVVSYTEEEEKRFVMIDSSLYRIGNIIELQNGAKVEIRDIEANSVVLRYKETQFRLSP